MSKKNGGMLSRGMKLLHDNAPVHTAAVAKAALRECGFIELNHRPYSPDRAPSDYLLFGKLKSDLRGRRFNEDSEVKSAVFGHFEDQTSDYFYEGLEKLIYRCNKCKRLY
jgi:hypothetical protein